MSSVRFIPFEMNMKKTVERATTSKRSAPKRSQANHNPFVMQSIFWLVCCSICCIMVMMQQSIALANHLECLGCRWAPTNRSSRLDGGPQWWASSAQQALTREGVAQIVPSAARDLSERKHRDTSKKEHKANINHQFNPYVTINRFHERPPARHHRLPSGPPPFGPSSLALALKSTGALDKLKGSQIYRRMFESKARYLFLDLVQQLMGLMNDLARKKIDLASANVAAFQAIAQKLSMKHGQKLKLYWPLVMMNPNFIKEILSNPTLLVMLFHAVEVAYTSTPLAFWLKPMMKMIKQPSPEKEEEVWWRRKRLYDVMNGPGSSELQPNLKTVHFREPGVSIPLVDEAAEWVRQVAAMDNSNNFIQHQQPEKEPTHTRPPAASPFEPDYMKAHELASGPIFAETTPDENRDHYDELPESAHPHHSRHKQTLVYHDHEDDSATGVRVVPTQSHPSNQPDSFMSNAQADSFLANQKSIAQRPFASATEASEPSSKVFASGAYDTSRPYDLAIPLIKSDTMDGRPQLWPSPPPQPQPPLDGVASPSQLMTMSDFKQLEPGERELVLREARNSFLEARLADELIKRQIDYVDSIRKRHAGSELVASHSSYEGGLTERLAAPSDEPRRRRRSSWTEVKTGSGTKRQLD